MHLTLVVFFVLICLEQPAFNSNVQVKKALVQLIRLSFTNTKEVHEKSMSELRRFMKKIIDIFYI